jgi:hypothetical protein
MFLDYLCTDNAIIPSKLSPGNAAHCASQMFSLPVTNAFKKGNTCIVIILVLVIQAYYILDWNFHRIIIIPEKGHTK